MTSSWLGVFGRLHLVVLHLPIGLLIGAAALEFGGALLRRPAARGTIAALAWLGAIAAVTAAGSGWVLAGEGVYVQQDVDLHRWLGMAVAAASLLTAVTALRAGRRWFRLLLALTVLLLLPAGHLGASLTHGDAYLFEPLRAQPEAGTRGGTAAGAPAATTRGGSNPVPDGLPQASGAFTAVVQPIFARNCIGCHGDKKQKGKLALNTVAGIQKGGNSGEVLVAGKPDDSELMRRCLLPLDDEDHMPPEGKPQPTAAELSALRAWIAAGAPFTGPVDGLTPAPAAPGSPGGSQPPPGGTPDENGGRRERPDDGDSDGGEPPEAPAEALAALRHELVHTAAIAQHSTRLWIDFAATAPRIDDAAAQRLLEPVRAQVTDLGMARTAITDATLQFLQRMQGLVRLDLRGTGVTDAGVARLRRLPHLQHLVLAQTKLTDAVVEHLAAMPALDAVYLWHAGVSAEALARLRSARPGLRVDAGDTGPAAPLTAEPQVQSTKGEPPVPAVNATAPAAPPVNTVCPVSGKPVDPRYLLLHDGKVIGFCCPNCPAEFKANPAKYPLK
ncbi:MAG TPA: c-type cytochrome domain-containing protein [Planctomycetota bacterium]|nr:c-type cytochrome domain-containing protein [Planctomycetota bacterium]